MRKVKKVLVLLLASCLWLTGCSGNAKQSKEQESTDWKDDAILASDTIRNGDWGNSMVENDQYIYYVRDDYQMIRFDKDKKVKKEIVQLKEDKEDGNHDISMVLNGKNLYYLYNNEIYQCDLDGSNQTKIANGEEIKYPKTEKLHWIDAISIYKDQMYLMLVSGDIMTFNQKINEAKVLTVNGDLSSRFLGDYLYCTTTDHAALHRVDLKTGKDKVVRGDAKEYVDARVMMYRYVTVFDGKLYYVCNKYEGEQKLYEYSETGKDKLMHKEKALGESDSNQYVMDGEKVIDVRFPEKKTPTACVYNIKTEKITETKLTKKLGDAVQVIDGTLMYTTVKDAKTQSTYQMVPLS